MAKAVFGEFGAFTSKNSIRYTKNNRMTSEGNIPPEVKIYLQKKLAEETPATQPTELPPQRFAPPTEEQKRILRAESLQVKPELQASPEKLAEDAAALTADDFDEPAPANVEQAQTEPSAEQMQEVSRVLAPDSTGQAPLPRADEPGRPTESEINHPSHPANEASFLESVSIHTAKLEDITRALYERFGIYTVYLRQLPNPDEVNPLTGEQFTKYHQGIAYQAAIGAQSRGVLDRKAEEGRRLMEEGRAASSNFHVDKRPETMGDARRADSFDYRTSARGNEAAPATEIVHITHEDGTIHAVSRPIPAGETGEFNGAKSRYDEEEDERIVEPQIGRQVVRPDW